MANTTLKIIGWVGTAGCGLLAAKGLGEFLPASKAIAWAVGGGLEAMNIATVGYLASDNKGNRVTKCIMGALVASTMALDMVGVAGQLASGYQADMNEQAAVTAASNVKADAAIAAAKAAVQSIDRQMDALTQREQVTALGLSKARGDRDQIKGVAKAQEAIKADRADLNAKRDAAVAKVAEAEARKGEVTGAAINASSEFAAAQFVAKAFQVDQNQVVYAGLGLMAVLAVLFPVCLMIVGGHKKTAGVVAVPEATLVAPVDKVAPEGVVKAPVASQKPVNKRSEAAKKGWETRKRNAAKAKAEARKVEKAKKAAKGKVIALTA
jgi:hypothetical protein